MAPLPLPPQRLTMAGASLLPPNEPGWQQTQAGAGLNLERQLASSEETWTIEAGPLQLTRAASMEDFVKEANALNARRLLPARYQLKKYEQMVDKTKGAKCIRAHIVTDDTEAARSSSREKLTVTQETLALTCTLPGSVSRGLSVTYSHRRPAAAGDPQFLRRASAVLDSVVLAPG
jgi:hypothetical protein